MHQNSTAPLSVVPELDLRELFMGLWRQRTVIGASVLTALLLAIVFIFTQPVQYTSTSVLQINARNAQVLDQADAVLSSLNLDNNIVQSEVDIIESNAIAGRVVDALNLTQDPLFNPSLQPGFGFWLKQTVKGMFGGAAADASSEEKARRMAMEKLRSQYWVKNPPRSLTLLVSARARSGERAAQIANAVAQAYLDEQLNIRFQTTKQASDWLGGRLDEMRRAVRESEQAVQQFRQENNLYEQQGLTLSDQQLSELNTQLILARTSRAEAQAKLSRARQLARSGKTASAGEVLSSPLIQRLREQEASLLREEADLGTRYGAKHPQMLKVKAEIRDLKSKIDAEIKNILGSLENDVAIAHTREQELKRNLSNVQKEAGTTTAAEVKLAELEREAAANRELYQSFLTRSKETNEQKDLNQADARLVARAELPLKPSHPKKLQIMVVALFAGLAVGVGIAFILERLDNGFRTPEQIENYTKLPLVGQLPIIKSDRHAVSYILEKPTSSYAEALRSIRTAIHFSNPDNPSKVVMITSSVTNEGKSTFASTLAALMAKSGQKVVLVDCDMRRPGTTKLMHIEPKQGLGDVLVGDVARKSITATHKESGLQIIPARADTPNSNELLGSQKMKALLDDLRKEYDLVVLDTPPVSAVADPLTLSELSDVVLYVVRWAETARDLVQASLKTLSMTESNIGGVVLSQVDVEQSRAYYGYGYGYNYTKEYYND